MAFLTTILIIILTLVAGVFLVRREWENWRRRRQAAEPTTTYYHQLSPGRTAPSVSGEAPSRLQRTAPGEFAKALRRTRPAPARLDLPFELPTEGTGAAAPPDYGPGSTRTSGDESPPPGYDIKGNENSMLYHTTDSPYYGRTHAEVWFNAEHAARAAGFERWDHTEPDT